MFDDIDEDLEKFLKSRDFEASLRGALAGYRLHRPDRRLYTPQGKHGIVVRLERAPNAPPAVALAAKVYFDRSVEQDICRRYHAIRAYLAALHEVPRLLMVPQVHEEGLEMRGRRVPVVTMPWVDGVELGVHVSDGYEKRAGDATVESRAIAAEFILGMWQLEKVGVSLGDVCPANVMVAADRRLRLVDYDNMFVPALHGEERFSGASVAVFDAQLASSAFDEHADRGAVLRLFVELYALSRERYETFRHPDWFLRLDDVALVRSLREQEDTRELIDYYLKMLETRVHPAPSEILRACPGVRKNFRRLANLMDGVPAALWRDFSGPVAVLQTSGGPLSPGGRPTLGVPATAQPVVMGADQSLSRAFFMRVPSAPMQISYSLPPMAASAQ